MSRYFRGNETSPGRETKGDKNVYYSDGGRMAFSEINNLCGVHRNADHRGTGLGVHRNADHRGTGLGVNRNANHRGTGFGVHRNADHKGTGLGVNRNAEHRGTGLGVHRNGEHRGTGLGGASIQLQNTTLEVRTRLTRSKGTSEHSTVLKKSASVRRSGIRKPNRWKTTESSPSNKVKKLAVLGDAEQELCSKFGRLMKNPGDANGVGRGCERSDGTDDDVEEPYRKYEDNLFVCTAYVKDINKYLRSLEDESVIRSDFMRGMKVTPRVRAVLIDWMIDVQSVFRMTDEALHLSVYLIDSYLSKHRETGKERLQLLSIACILVAGKYDQVRPPRLRDLLRASNNSCRRREVLSMEIEVLKAVDLRLNKPPVTCFLRRYGVVSDIDRLHHCCSKFFVDACLLNYSLCPFKPSLTAAAATFLSLCMKHNSFSPTLWDDKLSIHSKYDFFDILPLLRYLVPFILDLPTKSYSSALMQKFSTDQYERVKNKIYSPANLVIIKRIESAYIRTNPKSYQ